MAYEHLLSPVRIGSRVLKNRMVSTPSGMHDNRANEDVPTETLFAYYEGKARCGASLITVNGMNNRADGGVGGDYDMTKRGSRRAIARLVDGIHMYGALADANMHLQLPDGYDVCGGLPNQWLSPHGMEWGTRTDLKTAPAEMLEEYAEIYTDCIALLAKDCGFDGVFLHMAYRMMPLGRFLSPITNQREDQYGGSPENRFRYPRLVAELIRRKCGPEFLIQASISGFDPPEEGGLTTDDVAEYIKMSAGLFDMFQVKAPYLDPAHPIGFHEKTPWLDLCGELREKSGGAVPLLTVGGYTTPALAEAALASGKADVVGMARSWISNPDWVKLMVEGREDDIVPCLRCNKCHRTSEADPIVPGCSVNPTYGIYHLIPRLVQAPERNKKIGVVGGGPAGMRAAMMLADRGHQVTLYEAADVLGGQLEITRDVSFKWPLQDYRAWLIRQVEKRPAIRVRLNTRATKEMLAAEHFDEILVCVGAEPKIPAIPGAEGPGVMTFREAYGAPETVGQRVVIVGGGEIGAEAGIYFARAGRDVSVMGRRRLLAMDSTPIHYYGMFREEWEKLPNFTPLTQCEATAIDGGVVRYRDRDGAEQTLPFDTVILAVGMKSRRDEAMSLCVEGVRCHMIGDCNQVGDIQKLNRVVYGLCSSI